MFQKILVGNTMSRFEQKIKKARRLEERKQTDRYLQKKINQYYKLGKVYKPLCDLSECIITTNKPSANDIKWRKNSIYDEDIEIKIPIILLQNPSIENCCLYKSDWAEEIKPCLIFNFLYAEQSIFILYHLLYKTGSEPRNVKRTIEEIKSLFKEI